MVLRFDANAEAFVEKCLSVCELTLKRRCVFCDASGCKGRGLHYTGGGAGGWLEGRFSYVCIGMLLLFLQKSYNFAS